MCRSTLKKIEFLCEKAELATRLQLPQLEKEYMERCPHFLLSSHWVLPSSWQKQPGLPVAKFIVPALGDTVDTGIGMSYRPASQCSLAGRYDKPLPELTLSPQSGTMNLATAQRVERRWTHIGRPQESVAIFLHYSF